MAYHQPNELEYQYTLEPRNDSWIQTSANLAQFQALDPGSYTFKVRARTRNSLWSPEQRIQFNISRPFWMQWWFVVGLVLAGLFILYRLFAWIYNDLRERREIKEKLQASQMTALRAQMNPHFLFNSLNSIQEFIINQDKREANRYLTRFSRLMRNILNMSEMEEVYLQQEIETLELYLSLEALRFEENFEYHFDIGKMIDTESMTIPPMLVQPYVENAVKHGLMHKKDGVRHLWVRFYVENKMLVCEVEDNGIGREKARAIQQNNQRIYESKAMEMTEQRLRLLNRAYDNTLDVKVEDLVDPAGEAAGTKVTLYISLDE
ncbi:MAG: histidine kinase [Bacteroidota bacterium]